MFNKHLNKCTQEKRELSSRFLEDLTILNPDTEEFQKLKDEFAIQVKDLIEQLQEKDNHILELNNHLEKVSIASDQVREKYQELVKKEEESSKSPIENTIKRSLDESLVENEKLHLIIKEKSIEIGNLQREIDTLKLKKSSW